MKMRIAGMLLLLALLVGCNAVIVDEPVGPALTEDLKAEEWTGYWLSNESEPAKVIVADPKTGRLIVAGIDEKGGKPELGQFNVLARPWDEGWMLTVLDADKSTTDPQKFVFQPWVPRFA